MNPRALLQRLMEEAMLNPNSLSEKTGKKTKQPQIHRFLEGTTLEPKRSTLEPVAKVFGVSVEAFFDPKEADRVWAERFADKAQTKQPPKGGHWVEGAQMGVIVAQEISHLEATIDPPTIEWGDSLPDHLPQQFKMALRDDALAPDYPAGALFIWSTTKAPRIGSVVLVRDSYGQQHARRHRQGRAPGQWVAEATGPGFMPFDGADVTLLAVADWQPMP